MKRRNDVQQVIQLSLFDQDSSMPLPHLAAILETLQQIEASIMAESKEAYERRRIAEMAEKLGWPSFSLEKYWPSMKMAVAEGEPAWRTFLAEATSGTGLVMLALHKLLDPLTYESIDGATGLQRHPVEVIDRVEERCRTRMIKLAEALDWPRISYWAANETHVIGPEEEVWRKYFEYGCFGTIADIVGALEHRLRGEPEMVKRGLHQLHDNEED